MQITRWNPFVELDDFQQRLNRLFNEKAVTSPADGFADFVPPVDIQETDNEFIVRADLPQMTKDEVKVHLENGVLAIEGERHQEKEKEEKGKRFHRLEREFGKFVRRFAMPIDIDPEKVRAEFKDGVLNVYLPKAPSAKPKLIDVKVL
jgi:HSP20 family protein